MAEFSFESKVLLGSFAVEMRVLHPDRAEQIDSIRGVVAGDRLSAEAKERLITEVNKDPATLIDRAKAAINQDPSVLDRVQSNPNTLLSIMGIEPGAAPNIDAVDNQDQSAALADVGGAAVQPEPNARDDFQSSAQTAARVEPDQPAQDDQTANANVDLQNKMAADMGIIKSAKGFDGFLTRVNANPALSEAFSSLIGEGSAQGSERSAEFLDGVARKVEEDPAFFENVNDMIDNAPPQMLASFARDLTNDPAGALAQMDNKMALNSMFNNFSQSGFGQIMGDIFKYLGDILKALMPVLGQALGNLPSMIGNFAGKLGGAVQGISQSPRSVVSNSSDGQAPLVDILDRQNGGTVPQTNVAATSGQPVIGGEQPVAGQGADVAPSV